MGEGVILGAGIYALVAKAALLAGNTVWISFVAASVVAGLTGLSYAELSAFIPKSGGEYYCARRAFGEFVAFLITWLLLAGLAIAAAAVALGFGGLCHVDRSLQPNPCRNTADSGKRHVQSVPAQPPIPE